VSNNAREIRDRPDELIDTQLVFAHSLAALVTVLIAIVFGILISIQFFWPDAMGSWITMAWGRLRYAHTQGIMLGWLGNAFLAFLYHAVPVLTGRKVTSSALGRWLFGLWNFIVVLPGWALILSGVSQPIEWAEFPLVIDIFVIVALLIAGIQFLPPFFRNGLEDLYVSSWYIIGGLVFTLFAYPMGNTIPELVPGAESAAFTGLWIHDAVGLFVTPLALSILYYVIPATTGRPVFSHFLSMLGFWGLFFLYPLNGTHHYVFSVIPMAAQLGAIAASALLGFVVVIVVTNLLMSLKGEGWLPKDIGLRFVMMSIIFYLVVSVQGASQAQMSINKVIHFSDWVIAHSHLAMLGFATFAAIGGIIHVWERIPWTRFNPAALNWSFWLLVTGITVMFVDLTIAGLIQAELWQEGAPWLESVQQSKPYWMIRTLSAIPITLGFMLLFYGLCSGTVGAGGPVKAVSNPAWNASDASDDSILTSHAPLLRMSYRVSASAAIVFFALSVLLLGFWPGRVLDEQIELMTPEGVFALSASEQRGRAIYAREGCGYCHTQQIRYTESDIARFGAPTLAWEGQFDSPHLWGTRRVGPDLSRAAGTRNEDWHYAHLFDPRSVVPWSVMPGYGALFDGSADKPKQDARDLLAYLETLGRARELAWPDGEEKARELFGDDKWVKMSISVSSLNNHPARADTDYPVPLLAGTADADRGAALWQTLCAGCHGETGIGDGPAARWLAPPPLNLTQHTITPDRIVQVLWQGVPGTSMPAWRDLPESDLAALVTHVRSLALPDQTVPVSAAQLSIGAEIYVNNCIQCHGERGDGRGFAADELPVPPTNFTVQRASVGESIRILNNGIEGSSMAPWNDKLSENEILAVTHYLRAFYQEAE